MSRSRRVRGGRPLNGIVLLNKPRGLTSNAALQQVKWFFKGAKAGHTGALDPLATGLLPICFGEATKFSQYLLESDKTYTVVAQLGVKTETGDAEGEVVERRPVPQLERNELLEMVAGFQGEGTQIPSMYSALKHNGEPLYKLARQGISVEREARPITIYRIELLEHDNDLLTLEVHCSKGTYIRTLVEDLGELIGCGANVIKLHRSQAGPYVEAQMYTMEQLQARSEQAFAERAAVKDENPDVFAQQSVNNEGSDGAKGKGKRAGKAKGKLVLSDELKAQLDYSWRHLDELLLPVDSAVSQLPSVNLGETAAYYLQQGQAVTVANLPSSGLLRLNRPEEDGSWCFIGVGEVNDDGLVAPSRLVVG